MSFSERVDALYQKADNMMTYADAEGLIELMKEIVGNTRNREGQKKSDRERIYKLGTRVQKRIIELLGSESTNTIRMFKANMDPRNLLYEKRRLLDLAEEAPTADLRRELKACAKRLQDALDENSEKLAEYHIIQAENSIAYAEEILAFAKEEGDLRVVENNLRDAESFLGKIRKTNWEGKMGHLWYVGLPRVAKKRGMSAEGLYENLWQQIRDAWQALAPLLMAKHIAFLRDAYKRRSQVVHIPAELTEKWRQEELEREICAIERRNKQAGQVARQFLEHVKLGDAKAAWSCIQEIIRLDGGASPLFMEEYRKIAANQ